MDDLWEHLAQTDPLWAILSDPSKRGRKWRVDEFLETGRREISLLLHQLRRLGHYPESGLALDFGCGVGRLTQALGDTFAEAIGIDVSPTMIRLAENINSNPRVRFLLNQSDSLALIETASVDLLYSDIVLQHVEPKLAKGYLTEFVRVLAPMGVCVFQLPSHKRTVQHMAPRPVRMDPHVYRAGITIVPAYPVSLRPGQSATFDVAVRNDSNAVWSQEDVGVLRVGNHWRDASGAMIIQDDGRTRLPEVLGPGEVAHLQLNVRAPEYPGQYRCEFDVVHEGVSWFGDIGSDPVSTIVSVSQDEDSVPVDRPSSGTLIGVQRTFPDIYRLLPSDSAVVDPIEFPMHGVPSSEVIELLRVAGADVFYLEEDERGGPEWCGYRYFIRRRSS